MKLRTIIDKNGETKISCQEFEITMTSESPRAHITVDYLGEIIAKTFNNPDEYLKLELPRIMGYAEACVMAGYIDEKSYEEICNMLIRFMEILSGDDKKTNEL
jgi:hypothetical protein